MAHTNLFLLSETLNFGVSTGGILRRRRAGRRHAARGIRYTRRRSTTLLLVQLALALSSIFLLLQLALLKPCCTRCPNQALTFSSFASACLRNCSKASFGFTSAVFFVNDDHEFMFERPTALAGPSFLSSLGSRWSRTEEAMPALISDGLLVCRRGAAPTWMCDVDFPVDALIASRFGSSKHVHAIATM